MKGIDISSLKELFSAEVLMSIVKVLIIIAVGIILIKLITFLVLRFFKKWITSQGSLVIRKLLQYAGIMIIIMTVLTELKIGLAPLLGAAGILGIALGFASQTSVSNLISGLFLISEKPFEMGDIIRIGDTSGIILSIDLLSVKIRTFDNKFIRIPNEKLLNSELTNLTRFPIRRLDIELAVAYKEDLKNVKKLLLNIAESNTDCLDEPEPVFVIQSFGDSGIHLTLGVWVKKGEYLKVKNAMMISIKERFADEGIEFPFPHRTIYMGSHTKSLSGRGEKLLDTDE